MLSDYQHLFKYKNYNHFRTIVTGLINTPHRATLTNVYQTSAKTASYWVLPKFLFRGQWCADKVASVLTHPVRNVFRKGVYVYDETDTTKTGKSQYGLHFFRSTSYQTRNKNQSKFHYGHQFGALGWLCETPVGPHIFLLSVRVMCPSKKRDASAEVLKRLCGDAPPGLIVFDQSFNRRKVFEQILSQGHHLLCRAKSMLFSIRYPPSQSSGNGADPYDTENASTSLGSRLLIWK